MKTIIFDFDGTLGDTQAIVIKSFKETVVKGGYPEPSAEACASIIGLAINDCFTTLMGCSDAEAERLADIYQNEVFPKNLHDFKVKPFPGVMDTLEELKRQNYIMAIATSRSKDSAEEVVPLSGIDKYISVIIAPQDVVNGKPAPDLALKILEMYNANPADTYVVGDAPFDILMGKNAGCKTCAVTYGNGTLEDLKNCQPDAIIDNFADLLKVLEQ